MWITRDLETGAPIGVGDVPTEAVRMARAAGHERGITRPARDAAEFEAARRALEGGAR